MPLYAARALKAKDPHTGGYKTYIPGEAVPDEVIPDVPTLVNQGYLTTTDSGYAKRPVARHKGNLAVDLDGNPIPPGQLAHFKAERDVRKIKNVKELQALARKHEVVGNFANAADLRKALIAKRAEWYGARPTEVEKEAKKEAEAPKGEMYEDDRYSPARLEVAKLSELQALAADLGITYAGVRKGDLKEAIKAAPWTAPALVRLSPSKLKRVASDLGADLFGDETPQDLITAILETQKKAGE